MFQQLQQWAAASAPALQQQPSGLPPAATSAGAAPAAAGTSQAAAAAATNVSSSTAADVRQLPTAVLSVASSSNIADTYAHLIATLKKQVGGLSRLEAMQGAMQ